MDAGIADSAPGGANATSYTVTGLTNGTAVQIQGACGKRQRRWRGLRR